MYDSGFNAKFSQYDYTTKPACVQIKFQSLVNASGLCYNYGKSSYYCIFYDV